MNLVAGPSTLQQYVFGLQAAGIPVFQGEHGAYWVSSADRVMKRLPTFNLTVPTAEEVDAAMLATGSLIGSYVTEPPPGAAGNAWLYLRGDRPYSLEQRPAAMQRNVRRAIRELAIEPLSVTELMRHGARAFCETRRRNGLDDGTLNGFHRYFEHHVGCPGRAYLGAWKNGGLAGFVTIVHVDDWAELGSFSMTSMLRYRPNDGLLYAALSGYLADPNCRVVCYGLSSIEPGCETSGLHRFKLKVGFDAQRVHRAFVLHPRVRPFATRATLAPAYSAVRAALRFRPCNRRLKKIGGLLAGMLRVPSPVAASGAEPRPATIAVAALNRKQLSVT